MKSYPDIQISDFIFNPVWRFTNSNYNNELEIEPVQIEKVNDLTGLIIGSEVKFSDGSNHFAIFQNVSFLGNNINDHLLTITLNRDGAWFPLARYHDVAVDQFGPNALAVFMGKNKSDIFPIEYNLNDIIKNKYNNIRGYINENHISPLTRSEIISMIIKQVNSKIEKSEN